MNQDYTQPSLGSAVRARVRTWDAVTALTVFIFLLIAIPSRLVFAPLGGAGTPAEILGMVAALMWLAFRLAQPRSPSRVSQPIRWAMLAFVGAVLASYVVAMTRPIDDMELRAADRGLLIVCAWLGIYLVATDSISSRARLETLLRRLVFAGGALATLGILQFFTKQSFTNYLHIPGLSENSDLVSIMASRGFARPAGTALHPIEFGVTLTMILPFALHYALAGRDRRPIRRWFPVLAIGLAVPISISRSAIIGVIVVLAFLLPTWTRSQRRWSYAMLIGLLGVLYVIVPGLLGTLSGMFTGISSDSSALSRTDSYALAGDYFSRSPVFGRGFATFLPSYRILDNQYLGTLIELGIVGLAAVLTLFLVGIFTARAIRRRAVDMNTRQLAQALAASIAAGACSFALFDAFSFPMVASLMFLVLGAVGALLRLQRGAAAVVPEPQTTRPAPPAPLSASVR